MLLRHRFSYFSSLFYVSSHFCRTLSPLGFSLLRHGDPHGFCPLLYGAHGDTDCFAKNLPNVYIGKRCERTEEAYGGQCPRKPEVHVGLFLSRGREW